MHAGSASATASATAVLLAGSAIGPALEFAKIKLGLEEFKKHQTTAIRNFVQGHDLVVNLPTGFGKSVIFQAATIVIDYLNGLHKEPGEQVDSGDKKEKSLVIVVLPLKALAVEQLQRAQQIGLVGADVTSGITSHVLENVHRFSILFASPETLLGQNGKELLKLVRSRCRGIFIDESHCVAKW